jgi:hypothetical protein
LYPIRQMYIVVLKKFQGKHCLRNVVEEGNNIKNGGFRLMFSDDLMNSWKIF